MKIKYSNHVYGEEVAIVLATGKKVTLKADEELEVTPEEGKSLTELEAFSAVRASAKKEAEPAKKEEVVVTKTEDKVEAPVVETVATEATKEEK